MRVILRGIKNRGDATTYSLRFVDENGNTVDPSVALGVSDDNVIDGGTP